MNCQMMGCNQADGKITCRLTNDVMRPHFDVSASEMRKVTKEDKKRGNKLANDGGKVVLHDLKKLSTCRLRLICSTEEFFHQDTTHDRIDGSNPILELYAREEL